MEAQLAKEIISAIKEGDLERLVALIGADSERMSCMTPFGTWLHIAAGEGKLAIVKLLVDSGADINARGGILGGSPLNAAASAGQIEIVQYLLSCGAELDVSDPQRNPLFSSIYGGHVEIARLLINSGIDIDVKYTGEAMRDTDAIAFARQWGRTEIVNLLVGKSTAEPGSGGGIERPKSPSADFNVLRERIADAARRTFDAMRRAHRSETFYVFALCTTDDVAGINPSANSEHAYQQAVARRAANESHASLLGDLRWSAYDWKYECAQSDDFEPCE